MRSAVVWNSTEVSALLAFVEFIDESASQMNLPRKPYQFYEIIGFYKMLDSQSRVNCTILVTFAATTAAIASIFDERRLNNSLRWIDAKNSPTSRNKQREMNFFCIRCSTSVHDYLSVSLATLPMTPLALFIPSGCVRPVSPTEKSRFVP